MMNKENTKNDTQQQPAKAMNLSSATLAGIDAKLGHPQVSSSEITAGILHVGVGNFHRSHMATYLDDLFRDHADQRDWGIVGAGIMKFDQDKRDLLQKQGWLQTLVERDADMETCRIIRSMVDFLPVEPPAEEDAVAHAPLRQALLDPAIRIVSLTVTEGGYYTADGRFDPTHPHIQRDAQNPGAPRTIFGMIVQALNLRRQAGTKPFTVLSCDNVPHNGDIAKSVVIGLAELQAEASNNSDLADWIRQHVTFPNSMVDRITIATSEAERAYLRDTHGIHDDWPVFCEPFRQWILQDDFCNGRPALERLPASAGICFVQDVAPYEAMKIRVLNGGHASLCYPAALLGVKTVSDATQHGVIAPFLDALEQREIIPSVPPVPNTDVTEYWKLIAGRFSNPNIGDAIGRICYDGASRQPKFIVAPAANGVEEGRSIDGLALVSAMWCRYSLGTTQAGVTILEASHDPNWQRLHQNAVQACGGMEAKGPYDPAAWLGMRDVYGNVGTNERFVASFSSALHTICQEGVEAAMQNYIAQEGNGGDDMV